MRFGSVCSGIEAATAAWKPIGWEAAWLSEIEPFPCAVLAHHYPEVPNLGDMTTLPDRIASGGVEAPDVFTGGTPCQAFSVAGKRGSLSDDRGNLSLTFVEIADAIDDVRAAAGRDPCIVVWENVPGVLSTSDNAFGCFLGALAGSGCELQPAGGRWTNAGLVLGPRRAVAWRVIDAQYFGLAQRRRRVFVVASARKGFDPATVLFEWDGVRRDTPPSREARQTAPTIPARSTAGGGLGTDFDLDGGVIQAPSVQVCPTLRAGGNQTGGDQPPGTDVDTADSLIPVTTHTLRGEGFDASEDGTGRGTPLVPNGVTIHGTDPTVQKVASYDELAQCLRARTPGNIDNSSTTVVQQPVAYGIRTANTSSNGWGIQEEVTHTLDCAQGVAVAQPVAYAIQAGALRVNPASGPNGTGVQADHAYTLEARAEVQAVAYAENSRAELRLEGGDGSRCGALSAGGGKPGQGVPMVATTARIRRITPLEAERLMGFPDNYTAIPWRNKPAEDCPDGPRYRALGNSWAVPCAAWIGARIAKVVA